jgi:peptidoglycan/LPS O-acetylase OafA/YrhL
MRPFGTTDTNTGLRFWLDRVTAHGDAGVGIFFVLSGFLITIRYMNRIQPTWKWAIGYMQNRFARIYPVYFLITALTFLVFWVHPLQAWYTWPTTFSASDKLNALMLNLLLVRSFFQDLCFMGVPAAWSLTVEECFYVTAPFVLLVIRNRPGRLILYPAFFLSVGLLLVYLCSRFYHPYELMGTFTFMLRLTFFGRCTEFALGMGLGIWVVKRGVRSVPNQWAVTLLGIVGILGCMTMMDSILLSTGSNPSKTAEWLNLLLYHVMLPSTIVVLFWGLLHEQSLLRKLLETNTLSLLGKSSYCFYLIHLGLLNDVFDKYVSSGPWVKFGLDVAIAILLYKLIEAPLQRRLQKAPAPATGARRQYYLVQDSDIQPVWQKGSSSSWGGPMSTFAPTTFRSEAVKVESEA